MTPDEKLESLLKRRTRFRRLVHRASCDSTQDLAAAEPTDSVDAVFWADHQLRGRGRQQRNWHDDAGLDVLATFRVRLAVERPIAVPAAMPVAVLQTCEPTVGRRLRIKWPNDVYCDDRKLSGVIVDRDNRQPDVWRIGIGINVNRTRFPTELEATATSLACIAHRPLDRAAVLLALAEHVDRALHAITARDVGNLEQLFADRLGLLGRAVEAVTDAPHDGVLTAIDFERLVLDGRRELPLAIVRSLRARP